MRMCRRLAGGGSRAMQEADRGAQCSSVVEQHSVGVQDDKIDATRQSPAWHVYQSCTREGTYVRARRFLRLRASRTCGAAAGPSPPTWSGARPVTCRRSVRIACVTKWTEGVRGRVSYSCLGFRTGCVAMSGNVGRTMRMRFKRPPAAAWEYRTWPPESSHALSVRRKGLLSCVRRTPRRSRCVRSRSRRGRQKPCLALFIVRAPC